MLGMLLGNQRSQIYGGHGVNVTRWDAKSVMVFVQTKSGLGCRLCSLRHKDNKSPQKTRTQDSYNNHKTHHALGTVRPIQKGNFQQHAFTRRHVLAVATFFGAQPIMKLAPNTLADVLPSGVPTPKDWWMLLTVTKKGMSAAGFADARSADIAPTDDLLAISKQTSQELPKMLFVYNEVIMHRFRGRISQAIDLSLTSDAKKPVVE